MEVRDTIHGLIEYNDTEEKIINSQLFQRLRGIKQLALASLVYPGAHHTRFEHSLGVMYLAGKVSENLELSKDKTKILRLAGLLHDIGHGPFSHVSEQIIEKNVDKSILEKFLQKYKAGNVQEMLSIAFIEKNEEIKGILSKDELDEIKKILQKEDKRSLEKDMVSGPLDVDKFDYLLRDSYFAGVKYGTFDIDKVIESLTPVVVGREVIQLGIKEEGVYSIEQLLLAKYHMNVQVYRHRLRRITDAMLVRGIEFALEEGLDEIENIYKFQDEQEYFDNLIKFDDEAIIRYIIKESKGYAKEFFERITHRQIFKEVFQIEIKQLNFTDSISLDNAKKLSKEQIDMITEKVARFLEIPQEMIIFDHQVFSNPTFKRLGVPINLESIMVTTESKNRMKFSDVSSIFSNPSIEPNREFIYIYAPLDKIQTGNQRREFINNNRDLIFDLIKEELK